MRHLVSIKRSGGALDREGRVKKIMPTSIVLFTFLGAENYFFSSGK